MLPNVQSPGKRAYNPCQQDYVGLETTDNINAEYEQLDTHQPKGRIILICDNAHYNHARLLKDCLAETDSRVESVFLPPYSPNLNLIERLRGFMKDWLLRTYYASFTDFKRAIQTSFQSLYLYAKELASLMTENFQIFNSV